MALLVDRHPERASSRERDCASSRERDSLFSVASPGGVCSQLANAAVDTQVCSPWPVTFWALDQYESARKHKRKAQWKRELDERARRQTFNRCTNRIPSNWKWCKRHSIDWKSCKRQEHVALKEAKALHRRKKTGARQDNKKTKPNIASKLGSLA